MATKMAWLQVRQKILRVSVAEGENAPRLSVRRPSVRRHAPPYLLTSPPPHTSPPPTAPPPHLLTPLHALCTPSARPLHPCSLQDRTSVSRTPPHLPTTPSAPPPRLRASPSLCTRPLHALCTTPHRRAYRA